MAQGGQQQAVIEAPIAPSLRRRARCRIAPTGCMIMGETVGRTAQYLGEERNSWMLGGCHIRRRVKIGTGAGSSATSGAGWDSHPILVDRHAGQRRDRS